MYFLNNPLNYSSSRVGRLIADEYHRRGGRAVSHTTSSTYSSFQGWHGNPFERGILMYEIKDGKGIRVFPKRVHPQKFRDTIHEVREELSGH